MALAMAMAEVVLIALMAHKLVFIKRILALYRKARMVTRMTIIECIMAVELQHMV